MQEAPDLVCPRETIGRTRPTFYVRAGEKWRFVGVASLRAIRLGAIQDYAYERSVDGYIRKSGGSNRILLAKGSDALLRLTQALRTGRIDAFIENGPSAGHRAVVPARRKKPRSRSDRAADPCYHYVVRGDPARWATRVRAVSARWLEQCGCTIPRNEDDLPDFPLEISPAFAIDAEDLSRRLVAPPELKPGQEFLLS